MANSDTIRIEGKIAKMEIVGTEVTPSVGPVVLEQSEISLQERPQQLMGMTYKIKTPLIEHALYVTINDSIVDGVRRPFEIFINSKNMESFQWIVALTRVISAIFRASKDASFLIEELESIHDPHGGYIVKGRGFVPSLVAEIGYCIQGHLKAIGMQKEEQKYTGQACTKCFQMTIVRLEGCDVCESCGYSKCG